MKRQRSRWIQSAIVSTVMAALLGLVTIPTQAQTTKPSPTTRPPSITTLPPLKVLMIAAGQAHNYDTLPKKLADNLAKDRDLEVRVVGDLGILTPDELSKCDVMMFNNCQDDKLTDAQREAILGALRQGKGLVAMHCALYSFQPWPEWRRIVGCVVRGHDPFTSFESVVVDSDHPIARNVPMEFKISDEPYLAEEWIEDNHVIVQTAEPRGKRSKPEPMVWTTRYAGARVFSIMFGHDEKSHTEPAFLKLLANGTRWAGGRLGPPTVVSEAEMLDGFLPLFNGNALDEWRYDPALWRVENGIIIGDSHPKGLTKNSNAIAPGEYIDFVLRFSVKYISGNTGVQFRSEELPEYEVAGYQADVVPDGWGNLHEQNGRRRLVDGWTGKAEKVVNLKDWNEMEVIAQGPRIIIKTNGLVTADYTETDTTKPRFGIFSLQLHRDEPMTVQFTNLRVKPIEAGASQPAENAK
ncbi:MAG: ThuA domain-containing protein [Phycisphaerae bacterium]|nr:ThuA domain-containing protein [Phycisphaerae bacterium]